MREGLGTGWANDDRAVESGPIREDLSKEGPLEPESMGAPRSARSYQGQWKALTHPAVGGGAPVGDAGVVLKQPGRGRDGHQ